MSPRPLVLHRASPGEGTGALSRRSVVLVPEPDLLSLTGAMQESAVLGAVATGDLPEAEARRRALRLCLPPTLRRPLHPLLAPGAALHRFEVDGYRSKAAVVAAVALLAASLGLRRRATEALEQALDEMLLNALLDAPVDESGRPRYRGCPAAERIAVLAPPGDRAQVLCGGDGERFAVCVRDRFGSLRRRTVLDYLSRCARAQAARQDPLEHRSGGAGVGLFLIASCASELLFRLRRGRCSEVLYAAAMAPGPLRLGALYIDDDGDDGA